MTARTLTTDLLVTCTSLRLFLAGAAFLFNYAAVYSAHAYGAASGVIPLGSIAWGILAAAVAWLAVGASLWWYSRGQKSVNSRSALAWSAPATATTLLFTLLCLVFGVPAMAASHPFSLLAMALGGVVAATVAVSVYLFIYRSDGQDGSRSQDALRAEQQIWSSLFSGSIAWAGFFINGVLIAITLGAGYKVADPSSSSSPQEFPIIVTMHALLAGVAIVGTILWLLRPIHHRLQQIANDLDASPKPPKTASLGSQP